MKLSRSHFLRLATAVALLPLLAGGALARDITDSAGRTVTIPDTVTKVFPAGPPATVLVYMIKPDALAGWVRPPREGDLQYLLPSTHALGPVGRLTGGGDMINLEPLVAAKPDLVLDFGTLNQGYIDLANRVQEQSMVPYILIDGSFENTPAALRLVGEIVGDAARGEELAAFVEQAFADVDAVLASVPEDQRPKVYLARGPEGLETGTRGSINTAIIERVGGVNVVDTAGGGLVNASPEQILAWAPDTVITLDRDFAKNAATLPNWASVPAVVNGRVFRAPDSPWGFIDSPPAVNRAVGLYWLLGKLYPDQATVDVRAKVKEFYALFYQVEPSDAQLDALLG